jgi:hypothetical protein
MAIRLESVPFYKRLFARYPGKGRLMIFGRPSLMWDEALTPEEFFKGFGFDEVHTLDISDYQGASHVHDLNKPVPPEWAGQYDAVMTGGTLEHVYDIATALETMAALARPEGGLLHFDCPCNNWPDHGFYQVSPSLLWNFFADNGFDLETSNALVLIANHRVLLPIYPGAGQQLSNYRGRASLQITVRKAMTSSTDRPPVHQFYGDQRRYRFAASEAFDPHRGSPPLTKISLHDFRPIDGRWAAPFSDKTHPASLPGKPFRSPGLVLEEGHLLPWIVSDKEMVKERPGSFHHGPGLIHFSTTDATDPRRNGRLYELAFPDFEGWMVRS